MVIKHIVLEGGGSIGFRYIGILNKLCELNFINNENIESIYATSIGALIGTFLCINHDWSELCNYIINRPWNNVIYVSGNQIINLYSTRGLFDENMIAIILKPLLQSKLLSISITLKDFFIFSKIDIHFFTVNLNTSDVVDVSHTTHPDLSLVRAIYMSSAFPILCAPIIDDKSNCFTDGGLLCNYPIKECLDKYKNPDEILGLRFQMKSDSITITTDSNIMDYISALIILKINDDIIYPHIHNQIICICDEHPMNISVMTSLITNSNERSKWIDLGKDDAQQFIDNHNQSPPPDCDD